MSISKDLIDSYYSIKFENLDQESVTASRNLLMDCIGNIVASYRVDKNEKLNKKFIDSLSKETEFLPFFLGMLIHRLDFDDTHYGALIHTGSITVPAAIYSSFLKKTSGEDLLTSICIGVELAVTLASVEKHMFHKKGFHATALVGPFSSSLIYSYLNGYSKNKAIDAFGIAGSFTSGNLSFLNSGDNTKIVHPGWASFSGCKATEITNYSVTGSESIFEDDNGFFSLYSNVENISKKIKTNVDDYEIKKVNFKPYPICQLNIASIRLLEDLDIDIDTNTIDKVTVYLPEDSYDIVALDKDSKSNPQSPYEAKFSIYWTLAFYLLKKELNVDSFEQNYLNDSQISNLANKIEIEQIKHTEDAASVKGKVEIFYTDKTSKVYTEKNPNNSITDTEKVLNKFYQNTNLPTESKILDELINIQDSDDAGKIIKGVISECIKKY